MNNYDGTNTDGFGPQGPEGGFTAEDCAYFENTTREQRNFDILRAHCGGNFAFWFPVYGIDEPPFSGKMSYQLVGGAELHLGADQQFAIKLTSGEWMTFEQRRPEFVF